LRYMGGLAEDMCSTSVEDVARVVASLQGERHVRLEIHTMPWYREQATSLGKLSGVLLSGFVRQESYAESLIEADALLIAYNFDEISRAYVGLSLANKMPECLASGVPVLAYGPSDFPTITALHRAGCAQVVTTRSEATLRRELLRLVDDREHATRQGAAGRTWAAEHLNLARVRQTFSRVISEAASAPKVSTPEILIAPASAASFAGIGTQGSLRSLGHGEWDVDETLNGSASLWRATFQLGGPPGAREVVALVSVSTDRDATLRLRVSADVDAIPSRDWHEVRVVAGERRVLCSRGQLDTMNRAVQVEMSVPTQAGLHIDVDTVSIVVLESAFEAIAADGPQRLTEANLLYRTGQYAGALKAYVQLHGLRPLAIYAGNALLCARRLVAPV